MSVSEAVAVFADIAVIVSVVAVAVVGVNVVVACLVALARLLLVS